MNSGHFAVCSSRIKSVSLKGLVRKLLERTPLVSVSVLVDSSTLPPANCLFRKLVVAMAKHAAWCVTSWSSLYGSNPFPPVSVKACPSPCPDDSSVAFALTTAASVSGKSVPVVGKVVPVVWVLQNCGHVGAEARCGSRASRGMCEGCSNASKRA